MLLKRLALGYCACLDKASMQLVKASTAAKFKPFVCGRDQGIAGGNPGTDVHQAVSKTKPTQQGWGTDLTDLLYRCTTNADHSSHAAVCNRLGSGKGVQQRSWNCMRMQHKPSLRLTGLTPAILSLPRHSKRQSDLVKSSISSSRRRDLPSTCLYVLSCTAAAGSAD